MIKTLLWSSILAGLLTLTTSAHAKTITFIHFNDLHAHLTPHADLVPDAPTGSPSGKTKIVMRGGLARSATLIKKIRKDNPDSVLMNIGDTYHGGVEALFTNGNAIVAPVNALGIDVGVPGNWDYAYGPLVTRLRYTSLNPMEEAMLGKISAMMSPQGSVEKPNFPNLAANVTYAMPPWKSGQPFLPPTLIKEVGNTKVGFIGITSDIVPRMHKMLAIGLSFLQGEDNYRALIEKQASFLRAQGAEIVVVMSELGIHKDYKLAQDVAPGSVDVFFSAHTHEATFTPLTTPDGPLVVEAGNDGYVGRMDITIDNGKITDHKWSLIPVDDSIPEDPEMAALVQKARAPFLVESPNIKLPMIMQDETLQLPINAVVGHVKTPLDRRHALENSFNDSFAQALRKRGNTSLALTPGFRFDSVIATAGTPMEDNTVANGAVTVEDVYRFFPVTYTISKADLTGARLHEILEQALASVFSTDIFKQNGGWLEGFSGIAATLNLKAPDGQRVTRLSFKESGKIISDSDTLTVVGCSRPMDEEGILCSYDGFTAVQPLVNPDTGKPWTVTDLFIDMLKKNEIQAAGAELNDTSGTLFWPEAPFVQPLQGIGTPGPSSLSITPASPAAVEEPPPAEERPFMKFMQERRRARSGR